MLAAGPTLLGPVASHRSNARRSIVNSPGGVNVVRSALGGSGPKPGATPGARGIAASRRGPPAATLTADAPAHIEGEKEVAPAQMSWDQERLNALLNKPPADPEASGAADVEAARSKAETAKAERRRTSSQASTSKAAAVAAPEVFVPSTRRSSGTGTRAARRPLKTPAVKAMPVPQVPEGVKPDDEDAADTAFMDELRAWLGAGRRKSKRRGRASSSESAVVAPNMIAAWLEQLGSVPVLGPAQERRLAEINQRGLPVRAAAAELTERLRRRPTGEELAAALGLPSAADADAALARAEGAHGLMVEFNLRLVFSVARRYANNGCLDLSDLIPEGVVGLHKAVDRFDPGRGFKFSTYAHWWLRQAISRSISSQGRDIRIPQSCMEATTKLRRVAATLAAEPGRAAPPSHRELAAAMDMPVERLVSMLRATRTPRAFEDVMDGPRLDERYDEGESPMDSMWDEDDPPADAVAEGEREEFLRETINLMLSTLPKRERNVVRLRFGLLGTSPEESESLMEAAAAAGGEDGSAVEPGLGLLAVGATYGLSRERIRQIENSALRHLRMPWRMGVIRRAKTCESLPPDVLERLTDALSVAEQWG